MNYEKAYQEALERARKIHNDTDFDYEKGMMEEIFPELKESEDERIRKALIRFHKSTIDVDGIKGEDIIAWLEKQGTKELDPRYENLEELLAADDIYQMSMNDAMVNEAKEKAAKALSELSIGKLLGFEKQGEQKPIEWSKEDERIYCSILADIRTKQNVSTSTLESYYNEQISWLKSLKQRHTWKPSEEQIKAIRLARSFVTDDFSETKSLSEKLIELEEQLNKLRDESMENDR